MLVIGVLGYLSWNKKSGVKKQVVVYVSHDQDLSEPILRDFEKETGITVRAVYDTEATKTTGLVNRLIAEKNNPQADVFWNNEVSRTIVLMNEGVLEPYVSPNSTDIPLEFKDENGFWTGFAARGRVLLYNTDLIKESEVPNSIEELILPKWKSKVVIANPLFGSTASHAAALFTVWGDDKAKKFFEDLKKNEVVIVEGNSVVKNMVASGEVPLGLTDTDDANDALINNKPVAWKFLDQKEDRVGTLIFPNTVMLIKNAPHPKNAKRLIDFLLSREVEAKLANSKAVQMPLRPDVERPENVTAVDSIKTMGVSWREISEKLEISQKFLQELFVR